MAFSVRFNLVDKWGRGTSRTWGNSNALIADVITQIAVLAPLLDAVSQGGLTGVSISQASIASAFAFSDPSNIDENASIKVVAGDARNYDFDLPMPIEAIRLAGGAIDVAAAGVVALFAEFAVGKTWRINNFNPTDIVSVTSGELDK